MKTILFSPLSKSEFITLVVLLNTSDTGHNRLAQNRLSKCFIGATGCSFHPSISSATKDAGESIIYVS
jgi:hypothetical protein